MESFNALTISSYAAVYLAAVLLFISVSTIRRRVKYLVAVGDGGHAELQRLMRAQANFIEYVPMSLILMILCELKAVSPKLILFCAVLLCFGRTIHFFGVSKVREKLIFRQIGMVSTFASLIILASSLLFANL